MLCMKRTGQFSFVFFEEVNVQVVALRSLISVVNYYSGKERHRQL